MSGHEDQWEWLLLDARLGQASEEDLVRLRDELRNSPGLTRKDEWLGDTLSLLDDDEVVPPAADLWLKILKQTTRAGLHLVDEPGPAEEVVVSGAESASSDRRWGLRDVLALAACIALFFGLGVPGYRKAQQLSQRTLCLNNLRDIGQGAQAYAQGNQGYLPYANYVPGGNWLSAQQASSPQASNSRHVFKLVTTGEVQNFRIFLCPASPDGRPLEASDLRRLADFPRPVNNSYSFIFMNRPTGRRFDDFQGEGYRGMVLTADRNPYFSEAISPAEAPGESNSRLHESGAGQNAIYIDGSGGWFRRPAIGIDGDDIYRAGLLTHYRGTEEPLSDTDSFLP